MSLDAQEILRLLAVLGVTADEEVDCDEFLHRAAKYLETSAAVGDISKEDAQILQHLEVCPECCEEFESVRQALLHERRDLG